MTDTEKWRWRALAIWIVVFTIAVILSLTFNRNISSSTSANRKYDCNQLKMFIKKHIQIDAITATSFPDNSVTNPKEVFVSLLSKDLLNDLDKFKCK